MYMLYLQYPRYPFLVSFMQAWPDGSRVDAWSQLEVVVREAGMKVGFSKGKPMGLLRRRFGE